MEVVYKSIPVGNAHNFDEESIIVEPGMDPLDTSYHEHSELTENMMSKVRMEQVPLFKTATAIDSFMLPSRNYNELELRSNQSNVSENIHLLRNLNQVILALCRLKGRTSRIAISNPKFN